MDVAIRDYVNSYHGGDKYSTIYIPSKGRAGSTRTDKYLDSIGVSYVFVVEPQDESKYRTSNPGANILTLDELIPTSLSELLASMRPTGRNVL